MKSIFNISRLILIILLFHCCKKDDTLPPSVMTLSATEITNTAATLNGTANANNGSTTVSFEYGPTTSYGQIIQVQAPLSGSDLTNCNSSITGLMSGITYHYRIKAVNSMGSTNGEDLQFITTIQDPDGNIYTTTTIGTQTWLKENLKTTKLSDGTPITNTTLSDDWKILTTPAYCWYNNDPTYKSVYGALFNWYAVNTNKLCPDGWHVPSDAEWTILTNFLGGESVAGGKLKETGTTHWYDPNYGATNESGFMALPGAARANYGVFDNIGPAGNWWSSSENGAYGPWYRAIYANSTVVNSLNANPKEGLSIRCVRN
jgi:uncharacterized protein (TIGR02145 family)